MSFDQYEDSRDSGRPLRLYQFARGALTWNYTSGDRDVTVEINGQTLTFVTVRGGFVDDGIRQTGQPSADTLVITAPGDLAVASLYRVLPPSAEIELTIWDKHADDEEAQVTWVGSISQVAWPQLDRCKISCQSLSATMETVGLRMTWQRGCPHSLGDRWCTVDLQQYAVETRIGSLDGAAITVVPVLRAMRLTLSTSVLNIEAAGAIPYELTVENIGNVELEAVAAELTLPDGSTAALSLPTGDANEDGLLDVGETWTYLSSYAATSEDIAAGIDLVAAAQLTASGIAAPLAATATTHIGSTPAAVSTPVTSDPLTPPALPTPTAGGFALWYVDGEPERRGIDTADGSVLALLAGTPGLAAGMTVWVYPGCPGTLAVCEQFGNTDNYGGIPHLPGTSPFNGNPIF